MPELCIHDMEYGCTICSKKASPPEPERVLAAFDAKYEGQCPECNLPISLGQHCVKTSRERTIHEECFDA